MRVAVDALPFAEHRSRVAARETDMYVEADMAGLTFDTAELLRDIYHSPPSYWEGATGYANPAMDALLDRIDGELATYPRDGLLEQAWRMALDNITVVPLYRPLQVWAMREGLDLPIGPTSIPYLFEARLAAPR